MASFYLMKAHNIDKWQNGAIHVAMEDMYVIIADEVNNYYKITIKKGFRCDGLSVPRLFQWFLPSWDAHNVVYNFAGALHDGLYCRSGFGLFSRECCDDIFRSLLRASGISRFKAGCADKAVELFAGGKDHWGNDDMDNFDYINIQKV